MENFIEQLKQSGLLGRSGSNFPVWKKWEAVKNAPADKKYVVCNASEGEPEVAKDGFILQNYLSEVINGIKIAIQETGASTAYIYLNKNFYQKFKQKLIDLIDSSPIELFENPGGYLAGEETAVLNAIEGKRAEPRIRPPYPTEKGLWAKPTLINNVETFYWASKIAKEEYNHNRFYCISGDIPNPGVYELPETFTIKQVLERTANYQLPTTNYFYQIGGGAVGAILLDSELSQPIKGLASIIVFNKEKEDLIDLMKNWVQFLMMQNCDQCAPCREGLYRINEILQDVQGVKLLAGSKELNSLQEIFNVLEKTSLCPFGRTAYLPFKTALEKLT